MKQLQLIFDEYVKLKTDEKTIKESIADALRNSKSYQDKLTDYERVRAELKMIRADIEEDFTKELDKLSGIKLETEENKMMTSDVALTMLVKGETVEVEHKGVKYEAVLTARFKKVK